MRLLCLLYVLLFFALVHRLASNSDGLKVYYEQLKRCSHQNPYKPLFAVDKYHKEQRWKKIDGEDYVLTVSLVEQGYFERYKANTSQKLTKEVTWVTIPPELQNSCRGFLSQMEMEDPHVKRRQEELEIPEKDKKYHWLNHWVLAHLGMWNNLRSREKIKKSYMVVEIWVREQHLDRPCRDRENNDTECQSEFPENTTPSWRQFMNKLLEDQDSPFTGLGYTCNLNPDAKTTIGFSEYVILSGVDVIIGDLYPLMDYCVGTKGDFHSGSMKKIKPPIIIGHIAGPFLAYMLEKIGINCTLILTHSWVDSVHPSRLNSSWGQQAKDFPIPFSWYFGNRTNLTIGDIVEIKKFLQRELEKKDMIFYWNVTDIKVDGNSLVLFNDDKNLTLNMDGQDIFNMLSEPKQNPVTDWNGNQFPYITKLYQEPDAPQQMVIYGSGLAADTIRRDIPKKKLFIDRKKTARVYSSFETSPSETIPDVDVKLWTDLTENEKNKTVLDYFRAENMNVTEKKSAVYVFDANKNLRFVGTPFNAIGLQQKNFNVPLDRLKNTRESHWKAPFFRPPIWGNDSLLHSLYGVFSYIKTTYPESLTFSDKEIMLSIENLCFDESDFEVIQLHMKANGIELQENFFNELKEKLKALETPKTAEESIQFLVEIFKNTQEGEVVRDRFKEELRILFNKKHDKLNIGPLTDTKTDTSPTSSGSDKTSPPSTEAEPKDEL